jgi:ribosomal protein S18 acetylase RimI-like enzyme
MSKAEEIASRCLRTVLLPLPSGAAIPESEAFVELQSALEIFLPAALAERYVLWRYESIDAFRFSVARKTGPDEAELIGLCLLITDQIWTAMHLRLRLASSGDRIDWMELKLGQRYGVQRGGEWPLRTRHLVEAATERDLEAWLALAAEVGELFGADMAGDPAFVASLRRNVARGSAWCVRVDGHVASGMLLRDGAINWLAVAKRFQRRGVARTLVAHAQSVCDEVRVTTFAAGHPHPDAKASRMLYRSLGFQRVGEVAAAGPDGTPREELVWLR